MNKSKINYILLLFYSILVSLPHNLKLTGNDAFGLSWYAWAGIQGYWKQIYYHPTAIFGMYPLSGYPIFTVFILFCYLSITSNIYISWFLTSFTLKIIGTIAIHNLSRNLNFNSQLSLFVSYIYVSNPMFVLYTIGSISARASFIAVLPLFITSIVKLYKNFTIKHILLSFTMYGLLLLTHRTSLLFFPILILVYLIKIPPVNTIMYNIIHNTTFRKIFWLIYPIIILILSYYSTKIFTIETDIIGVTGKIASDSSLFFIELFIDLILREGISFIMMINLYIFGLYIKIWKNDRFNPNELNIIYIILLSLFPVCILLPISWYIGIILPLPLSLVAGIMCQWSFEEIKEKKYHLFIITLTSIIAFFLSLIIGLPKFKNIDRVFNLIYLVIAITLIIMVLLLLRSIQIKFSTRKYYALIINFLLISTLCSSYYVDTLTIGQVTEFPFPYLSDDEMKVADFLSDLSEEGRILTSNFLVGKRLMGLTGLLFYEDDLGGSSYVSNKVSPDELQASLHRKSITTWWQKASIYEGNPVPFSFNFIWWKIFQHEITNSWVQNVFTEENTSIVILTNDLKVSYGDTFNYSLFIDSLFPDNVITLLATNYLTIYRLKL
ncbi:MAG: hypothetical protein OEY49_09925 [Candidatus Heimdallarchaeota archaeon]|nr:hypothetical protein [Candidatus Heimdallarchaeota archaeon]